MGSHRGLADVTLVAASLEAGDLERGRAREPVLATELPVDLGVIDLVSSGAQGRVRAAVRDPHQAAPSAEVENGLPAAAECHRHACCARTIEACSPAA